MSRLVHIKFIHPCPCLHLKVLCKRLKIQIARPYLLWNSVEKPLANCKTTAWSNKSILLSSISYVTNTKNER